MVTKIEINSLVSEMRFSSSVGLRISSTRINSSQNRVSSSSLRQSPSLPEIQLWSGHGKPHGNLRQRMCLIEALGDREFGGGF
jgi:hypothetical protein